MSASIPRGRASEWDKHHQAVSDTMQWYYVATHIKGSPMHSLKIIIVIFAQYKEHIARGVLIIVQGRQPVA